MRWEQFSTARYAVWLRAGILIAVPGSAIGASGGGLEPSPAIEEIVVTAAKRGTMGHASPLAGMSSSSASITAWESSALWMFR